MLYIIGEDHFAWRNTAVCTQTLFACNFFLDPTVLFTIKKLNTMLYYRQSKSLWWAYMESSRKPNLEKNK